MWCRACKEYRKLDLQAKTELEDTATVSNEPVQGKCGYIVPPAEVQKQAGESAQIAMFFWWLKV